jgi:hypothetical protein
LKKKVRRRVNILRFWIAAILISASTSCGYRFSGQANLLPSDVRTVYIEPFINKTREVGLANELTSIIRSEFFRRGQLRLVDQLDQADAVLTGVVREFESHVLSVNRKDEVIQYEGSIIADAMLRRQKPDAVLWRGQGIQLRETYGGSRAAVVTTSSDFRTGTLNAADVRRLTDIQLTESESRKAREDLMERFARELHQRLMELF